MALEPDGRWRFVSYMNQTRGVPFGDPIAPRRGAPTADKPDLDRILGSWRTVEVEVGGDSLPKEVIATVDPTLTLTFSADKVFVKPQGTFPKAFLEMAVAKGLLPKNAATIVEKGTEGTYRLDPTKSPRQIDFTFSGEVQMIALGIYQLDGDKLKLCLCVDPVKFDQRPTEMATKAGQTRIILTLKRVAGAERPKTDTPTSGKQ